jgi:hypothetical protein
MEVSSYLVLSITIFVNSIHDLRISFSLIQYYSLRKYFFEARSVHIPITLGYFRDVLVFLDVRDQALDKIVFAQNGLSLDLPPDGLLADPPCDELTVFLLGLGSLSAELTKHPIDGKTGCRRFTSRRRPIAGPLPGFGSFNHPGPNRIQYGISANPEKMTVFLDEDRLVPSLEQMARPLVTFIEELSIDAV